MNLVYLRIWIIIRALTDASILNMQLYIGGKLIQAFIFKDR